MSDTFTTERSTGTAAGRSPRPDGDDLMALLRAAAAIEELKSSIRASTSRPASRSPSSLPSPASGSCEKASPC